MTFLNYGKKMQKNLRTMEISKGLCIVVHNITGRALGFKILSSYGMERLTSFLLFTGENTIERMIVRAQR
jgi:hypothetical protein